MPGAAQLGGGAQAGRARSDRGARRAWPLRRGAAANAAGARASASRAAWRESRSGASRAARLAHEPRQPVPSSVDGSSARQALARRDSGARDDAPASRRAGAKPYARHGAASMRRGAAGAAGALALTRVARASAAAAADRVAAASAPPTVVLGVAPSLSGACPPANTILVLPAHAGTLAGEVAGAARRSGTARGSPADATPRAWRRRRGSRRRRARRPRRRRGGARRGRGGGGRPRPATWA